MASLRGVWVMRVELSLRADAYSSGESRVIVSHRIGAAEARAKAIHGNLFTAVPTDPSVFLRGFAESATTQPHAGEPVPMRNVCSMKGGLWPVCWSEWNGVYFAAVPIVRKESLERKNPSDELPAISGAFGVLQELVSLCAPFHPKYNPQDISELQSLTALWLPFGRPQLSDAETVRMVWRQGYPQEDPDTRVPGWRPLWPAKGSKARVEFAIEECVDAAQYDSRSKADVWRVSGTITAHVDVEGVPEVSLSISCPSEAAGNLSVHPCAQASSEVLSSKGVKVQFTPPPTPFTLATYTVKRPPVPPIRGFYQLRDDGSGTNRVKLLLQLKLDESVNNQFQFLEVVLPFKNRGNVGQFQATPSTGSVSVGPDRSSLVWNIGQRIGATNLQVALPAVVSFEPSSAATDGSSDPFCTGLTAFARVRFRVLNWCQSSCAIDARSIAVFPLPKVKVNAVVERSCVSGEYVIWNAAGKARHAVPLALDDTMQPQK